MLELVIQEGEFFDELSEEFIYTKKQVIRLEHSLVSLSKWESKWCKPFLSSEKTNEEVIDYIRCMTITQGVDDNVYLALSPENLKKVEEYIDAPMTATWFTNYGKKGKKEIVTSELIYYWMITCNIPFECQKWHLNRLMTLIRVCSEKNAPSKKMSQKEIMTRNRELNAARRKALNSKG